MKRARGERRRSESGRDGEEDDKDGDERSGSQSRKSIVGAERRLDGRWPDSRSAALEGRVFRLVKRPPKTTGRFWEGRRWP